MSVRKKYRPRGVSVETWRIAMQGAMKLLPRDQEARVAPIRDAVDKISKGQAGKEDWQGVFDALNMLEQFSRMPKVMRGAADYVHSMQTVIVGVLDRQRASGSKALYPGELEDLRGFVDQWAEVLSVVTHREYFEAEEKTHQRLVSILRSKTPGVRVVEVV